MRKLLAILTLTLTPLALAGCDIDAKGTIAANGTTTITVTTSPLDVTNLALCDTYTRILAPDKDSDNTTPVFSIKTDSKNRACTITTTSDTLVSSTDTTVTINPLLRITKEDFKGLFGDNDEFTLTITTPAPIKTAEGAEQYSGQTAIYTDPNILLNPITITLDPNASTQSSAFPLWGKALVVLAILVLAYEAFTRLKPLVSRNKIGTPTDTTTREEPAPMFTPSNTTTREEEDDQWTDDFWA